LNTIKNWGNKCTQIEKNGIDLSIENYIYIYIYISFYKLGGYLPIAINPLCWIIIRSWMENEGSREMMKGFCVVKNNVFLDI